MGTCKKLNTKTSRKTFTIIGTPNYMAPENLYNEICFKSDIYSFGMCLIEILTKEIPYHECDFTAQIWKKIADNKLPESINLLDKLPKDLVVKCINKKPNKRLSYNEILNHNFLFIDRKLA